MRYKPKYSGEQPPGENTCVQGFSASCPEQSLSDMRDEDFPKVNPHGPILKKTCLGERAGEFPK